MTKNKAPTKTPRMSFNPKKGGDHIIKDGKVIKPAPKQQPKETDNDNANDS